MADVQTTKPVDTDSFPSRLAYEFQPSKPQLSERNLENLFAFIWKDDSHNYEHPRYRLQTALAILLFVHLGLHPTVALGEGFYYGDTRLILANFNGTTRVLLLICLKDRFKNQRSARRWAERTLILADNPEKRRLCPVTIFLSLALADGVIHSAQLRLEPSHIETTPAWAELRYTPKASTMHIWRRATGRVLSPFRRIKPNVIHTLMQAQIERAGHEHTLHTIMLDNKRAAQREKKRLDSTSGTPHMLVGRGQGKLVYDLLGAYLEPVSDLPWDPQAFMDGLSWSGSSSPHSAVETQLKYDASRFHIISYLYGVSNTCSQLLEVLWPFTEAAAPVTFEAYYPQAGPDKLGNCPWCGLRLARNPMKLHLLRCCQREKNKSAEKNLRQDIWECLWETCSTSVDMPRLAASHLSDHLSLKRLRCEWDSCYKPMRDIIDLHIHLEVAHQVYTEATIPINANFCFECASWIMCELDWTMHGVIHAKKPSIVYGPVTIKGLLAAPGRCPYCIRDGLYPQMVDPAQYVAHIERHITADILDMKDLSCPHPSCEIGGCQVEALREHFLLVHHIPL